MQGSDSHNFSLNVDDILNEESSSEEDPIAFDTQGKRYSKQAENDKIRRMLQQEQTQAKMSQKYADQNIDFDKIERELESKYGSKAKDQKGASESQRKTSYTKEELLQDSSEEESSSAMSGSKSDGESPSKDDGTSEHDAPSEPRKETNRASSPVKAKQEEKETKGPNVLQQILQQDSSDNSDSEETSSH